MSDFLEKLNQIVLLEPEALSENDKGFLKARSSYLTDEQKIKFSEILGNSEKPEIKKVETKKPKRSRKKQLPNSHSGTA